MLLKLISLLRFFQRFLKNLRGAMRLKQDFYYFGEMCSPYFIFRLLGLFEQ